MITSFPDELSTWGRDQLIVDRFVTYLRRVHEDAAPSDEWEEFLDASCCGDSLALTLRVGELDLKRTTRIDDETTVGFVGREGNVHDDWYVQSVDGPVSLTAGQRQNARGRTRGGLRGEDRPIRVCSGP